MTCPAPSHPHPVLHVPVRPGGAGPVVRLFRTALGAPTAVGFSTAEQLEEVLGAGAPRIVLAEGVLRSLVGPLGVARLTIDPTLVAPLPSGPTPSGPVCTGRRSPSSAATVPAIPAVVPA